MDKRGGVRAAAVVLWLVTAGVSAQEAGRLPSLFALEISGDSVDGRDYYLDLDYGLPGGARLLLSLGESRSGGSGLAITTHLRSLGLRADPLQDLSGGFDLEYWGEAGRLTSETLRMVLELNAGPWFVSLRPQWRSLTLYTDCIERLRLRCNSQEKIRSRGMTLDAVYYTAGPWGFSVAYQRHRYDREVSTLGRFRRFEYVFSASTLQLALGLEDYRVSVGISYAGERLLWNLSSLKSVSAVDNAENVVTTLRLSTELNPHWRLRLRVGSQYFAGGGERINFVGAGLAYSW